MLKRMTSPTCFRDPHERGWHRLGNQKQLADWQPRGAPPLQNRWRVSPAEALFYCLILTLPFEELYTIAGVSITKLAGLLFFIVSLMEWRTFYEKVPGALVVLLGFIGIGLAVDLATYAQVDFFAINQFSRFILIWWLMLAAYNLALNNRFDRVVGIIYAGSLLFAIFQSLSLGGSSLNLYEEAIYGEKGSRVSVLGTNPNFATIYIAVGVLFGLVYGLNLTKTRITYRILFLLGTGVGFYAMLKTGSRGGLLALGGGVLSLAFTARQWKRTVISLFTVACVIVVMGVAVAKNPYLAARFRASAETGNTSGRDKIWEQAVRLSAESPLYGFGASMQGVKLGEKVGSTLKATHNLLLSVLLGSGLAGLLCFLYPYAHAFKSIWSCRAESTGRIVFAWFALASLGSMTANLEITKWFWIVLALSLAAGKVYARRQASSPVMSRAHHALFRRVPSLRFSVRAP